MPKIRINKEISVSELRVIDAGGVNLGVLPTKEALAMAESQDGIDLVEISPNAKPPVARLVNFDKYRYQQEKAEKKSKRAQKAGGTKRVQVSARSAQNDLLRGIKKLEKFLNEGNQVEIQMELRGREKGNREWAFKKFDEFLAMIPVEYKIVTKPRFGGRGMLAQIAGQ